MELPMYGCGWVGHNAAKFRFDEMNLPLYAYVYIKVGYLSHLTKL